MLGGIYPGASYPAGSGFVEPPIPGARLTVTTTAALTAPGPLAASAPIAVSVTASLTAPVRFAAAASIALSTAAGFSHPLFASSQVSVTAAATIAPSPRLTKAKLELDGVDISTRVRRLGADALSISDVLNDAPNTCRLVVDGSPVPQEGQDLRITMNDGVVVLFAGTLQSVERSYDGGKPELARYPVGAIDDTARANWRRPFGTWTNVSASLIGASVAATFAPGFTTAIQTGLPAVTITFDGSESFIAAFVRLAALVGGYAKVEDNVIHLFTEDLTNQPDPIDATHPPLNDPPIKVTRDTSQLRTRVYGKGYGESVPTDVGAGETIVPIEDGVRFESSGGKAITGTTPDGAQSQVIGYTGVALGGPGTLVGPGAAPGNAPALALAAGAGVDNGVHEVAVVHVTAAGKTKAGPSASITVGQLAAPSAAPTANAPTNGTGPDQGTHDYVVTNVAPFGETTPSPISNPITTNAAVGQISPPGALSASSSGPHSGSVEVGEHRYKVTFVNANGETEGGTNRTVTTSPLGGSSGSFLVSGTTGGSLTPGKAYFYVITYVTAYGESKPYLLSGGNVLGGSENANFLNGVPFHPDGNVIARNIYRHEETAPGSWIAGTFYKVGTINDNASTQFTDTMAQASATSQPSTTHGSTVDTTGPKTIPLTNIPIGPAGTTARKIYRTVVGGSGDYKLVTTLSNNTAQTHDDTKADAQLGASIPTTNTTGTAVQVIPLTNIPLGPPGTTQRKIYRRFNASTAFRLVDTLNNNTAQTYTDSKPNSALGANAPTTNTAIANQIAVSNIPVGASQVTSRELYMSPAGGGTKRLALTIADNSTTTGTITISDATLAGNAAEPGSDTSGLAQPDGQVNPGATTLPLASAAPFRSSGGWVDLGQQVVRYTGISGQSLTGIPASGPGSIGTTVLYGQQALPAPSLLGVTGLTLAMARGAAVHIWVQRDDAAAQAEQAARAGGDGVVEYLITDGSRNQASLIERCDAEMAMFARPIVTVVYHTRDVKTKSGKPVLINLPELQLNDTLVIQQVDITEIDIADNTPPRFAVTASSVRFSLEDTLRRLVAA